MGIFFELQNPGAILPGVVGGISLILAFYAMHTLPVNYAGVLLILLAVILFIAEIKIPSYGMLTVGGIVSLALGSIMLFKTSLPFLQISWKVITFATVLTALFFLFVVSLGIRAQRRKPSTGEQGMIGEIATVIDNFTHRKGQVSTHGEIWEAESEETLKKGDRVKIVSMKNLVLFVKKDKS